MASDSAQTTDMILQQINNSITTLIDMVGDTQKLVNNNIITLIDMVGDNTQLLDGTIKNVTASLQQLITTQSLLENISNENKGTINNQIASLIFSCQDIKNIYPTSPSGYYHINCQLLYVKWVSCVILLMEDGQD